MNENSLHRGSDIRGGIGLTDQARSVWAKSGVRAQEWLPLTQHMLDSEAMAGRLFDEWLAPAVREHWGRAFPGGQGDAKRAFVFLASGHDVGKAAPVFVAQVETLAERTRRVGLTCPPMDHLRDDRKELPHATVSYVALRAWLTRLGVDPTVAKQLASVVGAHHGKPVPGARPDIERRRATAFGGPDWARLRLGLLDWLDARQGFGAMAASWPDDFVLPLPVLVGMSGLVIVADWLASNQDYFALRPVDEDLCPGIPATEVLSERAVWAWGEAAMPWAWAPQEPGDTVQRLYRSRFDWPDHLTPRPLQSDVVELVRRNEVGLMIIESDMGSGKTEAALVAAEILAAQFGAQGLFVALPTQATTDAMFGRVTKWLAHLPEPPADVPAWAMTLAHGKASLNREYADHMAAFDDFVHAGGIAGVDDDAEGRDGAGDEGAPLTSAVAHQWFRGPKRRLLANFGIGTIDQLLMAGLQQKHLMLRHLALAGKVVVIDECHASDEFMNVYLDTVLGWLGHYGVPVVALSATLTHARREAMVRAYAPQAEGGFARRGYPQITWVDRGRNHAQVEVARAHGSPREVAWDWLADDDDQLIELLQAELVDGGCALVVRNTVKDAQRVADRVRARVTPDVTLAHSRFLAADRADNDEALVQRFGPQAGLGLRPEKAVVVATQVVEQSLDVDFDLLVTDLAPMDLLFQRIGRLHRHAWRTRPARLGVARVHVVADRDGSTPTGNRGSTAVYGDHHLLRTGRVLEVHGHTLEMPADIAPLVEKALGSEALEVPRDAQTAFEDAAAAYEKQTLARHQKAGVMCLRAWDPRNGEGAGLGDWLDLAGDPDENRLGAMVRDTRPSLEVVVVPVTPDGATALVPPWMNDPATLDTSTVPDDDTARRIATWTVKLPTAVTPGPHALDAVIRALETGVARGWAWHRQRLLKGSLFLPMHQIREGSTTLETTIRAGDKEHHLRYTPERGLEEVADELQPAG